MTEIIFGNFSWIPSSVSHVPTLPSPGEPSLEPEHNLKTEIKLGNECCSHNLETSGCQILFFFLMSISLTYSWYLLDLLLNNFCSSLSHHFFLMRIKDYEFLVLKSASFYLINGQTFSKTTLE